MKTKISVLVSIAVLGSTCALAQVKKKAAPRGINPTMLSEIMKKSSAEKSGNKNVEKTKLTASASLKSKLDSGSYAFGMSIGEDLKFRGLSGLNYDMFSKALSDVFEGNKTALTKEQGQTAINDLFASVGQSKNIMRIVEGLQFFEGNKKKEGVIALDSGLQYEVLRAGTGEKPKPGEEVTVHYKGTLLDGTQFDSSYDRNQPFSTSLDNVIQGWKEGVPLMPVGSKYRFFVPYQLGYAENGSGSIPPYSGLIFEIELLKIGK